MLITHYNIMYVLGLGLLLFCIVLWVELGNVRINVMLCSMSVPPSLVTAYNLLYGAVTRIRFIHI